MNRYPGVNNRFIICDICGFKKRVKDTTQLSDAFSILNQMIVCKKCNEQPQPGLRPWPIIKEVVLSNPEYVRPEGTPSYADNLTANQLPSAPKNLRATAHPTLSAIILNWDGPEQMGSGRITGYVITRATPQLSYQVIIQANTGTEQPSYVDSLSSLSEESTYQVAAITSFGTGPYSDYAYWPTDTVIWSDINFLITSDTQLTLTTGAGYYIRLNHTDGGIL